MNTIFRSQIFPRLLNTGMAKSIPSICTSYVRNFSKTVFQDISIKPRDFYQILPLRENYKFVTQKNSEAYDIEDANRDAYYEGRYTRASNSLRSWMIRYTDPKTSWSVYTKPSKLRNETTQSIFTDSQDSHMTIPQIEEVLEKKGGGGLQNVSHDDLTKIWDRLKRENESDRMIELFHIRGPSNFTASPATLLDYCFANLKSSYSQPPTVTTFAKKLIEQKNLPQAHFILGLSHMGSAYIAKKLADLAREGKKDDRLEALYRECFYLAPYARAPQKY